MKQFVICLFFSILLYLGGAVVAGHLNPMLWEDVPGKIILVCLFFLVWFIPIYLNYMDAKPNFE